jgi:nucleoid DNA-binding protein
MDQSIQNLPEHIIKHLEGVTKSSGLPDNKESFEKIAKNWVEKKAIFESQIKLLDMYDVKTLGKDDKKGAILLTYSGSLISISPISGKKRWVEYASIKLRSDVPEIVKVQDTNLQTDMNVDKVVEFSEGPIKSTSPIFKIVVCKDDVKLDEQENRIREATIFLTNGFVKINRSLHLDQKSKPDQFNMKSIVAYISSRYGMTQKQTKQLIEDYLTIIETGMLLKERVALGKIGKMYLKKRGAKQAQVRKSPLTGEEITIKAKPAMFVPKMSYTKNIKEKATHVPMED